MLVQVLPVQRMDAITAMLPVTSFAEDMHLLMLTEGGSIKRTPLSLFQDPSLKRGLTAIKLKVPLPACHWCICALHARSFSCC